MMTWSGEPWQQQPGWRREQDHQGRSRVLLGSRGSSLQQEDDVGEHHQQAVADHSQRSCATGQPQPQASTQVVVEYWSDRLQTEIIDGSFLFGYILLGNKGRLSHIG